CVFMDNFCKFFASYKVQSMPVESRYVVPGASFQSLIKSYLVAAIGSGQDSPARAVSGSSWRRDDWRLYATSRTDDHLSRAAGHQRTGSRRTVRPRDCGGARLLSLDSAQMAPPWATAGAHRPQLPHGSPHYWTAEHSSHGHARC